MYYQFEDVSRLESEKRKRMADEKLKQELLERQKQRELEDLITRAIVRALKEINNINK